MSRGGAILHLLRLRPNASVNDICSSLSISPLPSCNSSNNLTPELLHLIHKVLQSFKIKVKWSETWNRSKRTIKEFRMSLQSEMTQDRDRSSRGVEAFNRS